MAESAPDKAALSSFADPDSEKGTLTIKRLISGTDVAVLTLPHTSTVGLIKQQLSGSGGTPSARLRLIRDNRVLDDNETLAELGKPDEMSLVELLWKTDEETYEIGDLVQLHHDGNVVFESLAGSDTQWMDAMNDMLGRTFQVKAVPEPGAVSLPSPVPSKTYAEALVTFPISVVRKGEFLAEGDIVEMNSSREVVQHSFQRAGYIWHPLMIGMLGKEFPILEMTSRGIIALPSPDGSQGGKWYFPVSVVQKVRGEHEDVVPKH